MAGLEVNRGPPASCRHISGPRLELRALPAPARLARGGRGALRRLCCAANDGEVITKQQVLDKARQQFKRATSLTRPDAAIELARTCLTIALEEEAAAQVFAEEQRAKQAEIIAVGVGLELGSASTWSLERLDLLAAEVRQVFEEQLAAVALEGEEGLAARLEALDPADRVDLSRVLALKPKPQRPAGAPPLPEGAEGGGAGALRVERFPALMVNAINEVLYTRHGFRRSQRHGEPRESHITALLEDGEGSPVAMGILYTEVCRRVGLPVAGMPIEDPMGQYYVLWPTKFPLKVGGLEYVVDPYGNGDLLQKSEVCEVFDITPGAIKPASNRRILSAVLSYMRDAYWARAVGCSPEPALMEPLDLASVSELEWDMEWDEGSFNLSRALACAERRLHLLPGDQQAQLQYALLHYAAGDFETAWQELGIYEERGAGADVCDEHIPFLMERLRMYLEFGVKQRPDGESTFPGLQITDHDDNSS